MVSGDEEGNMDQMIVTVLAIGALCWGLRAMPWKTVMARVRVAQGARYVACGHVADWIVEWIELMRGKATAMVPHKDRCALRRTVSHRRVRS